MSYKKFRTFNKMDVKGTAVPVVNGDVTKALRILKKKIINDGLFQELKEREFYESKGTKERKAKAAATRRFKKKLEKRKQEFNY